MIAEIENLGARNIEHPESLIKKSRNGPYIKSAKPASISASQIVQNKKQRRPPTQKINFPKRLPKIGEPQP